MKRRVCVKALGTAMVAAGFCLARCSPEAPPPAPATAPATAAGPTTREVMVQAAKVYLARANLQEIGEALSAFNADNGRYPTAKEGLQALLTRPADARAPAENWPYLGQFPLDPWGHPFIYDNPGHALNPIRLSSAGPDGKEGTDDDVFPDPTR